MTTESGIMKKILYITEQFPYPPDSGGKIKTLNTLNTLSKKFQVHLVSFSPQQITTKNQNFLKKKVASSTLIVDKTINHHVKRNKYKLIKNYLKGIPYLIFQYQNLEATQKIDQLIKKIAPEIIHIDHLNMVQYLPQIKNCAWIFEEHNLESDLLWSRFIHTRHLKTKFFLFLETLLTKNYERKKLNKFDAIFTISDYDKKKLEKKIPRTPIFPYLLPTKKISISKNVKSGYILFIGDLTWHPNYNAIEWFIENILPLVIAQHPQATLHLVGSQDESLKKYSQYPHVIFHGYQKNIKSFLHRAEIFIMPFKIGEGVRIKTLTALCAGIPIVSTFVGIKGLKLKSGEHYLLANTAKKFAENIGYLINHESLKKVLTQAGFEYLSKYHNVKNNQQFLKQYQKIIQ